MKNFAIFALLISVSTLAQDRLETIEVVDHEQETQLEHYGHSSKKLHTRELKKRRETSLGDTLKSEAGVTSNSFGPNASRPVIRGLDGDRIKLLQNGLGVLDASAQSADHAVPVDTLIVDSIEIVRGPLSLLYGSSAVGGVVNITTNRIHSHFEEGAVKEVQIQGDTASNGVSTGAKLDFGKNNWMIHLDGGYRNSNDQRIPGFQESSKERQSSGNRHKDTLVNSMSVQKSAAAGVSKIFSKGYAGVSYYRFDNYYGTVAEEAVKIQMKQDRIEAHGEWRPEGDLLTAIRFKTAQSDYAHKELEGSEVGTTFANEGNESRLEFLTKTGDVTGISGFQTQFFNFKAIGDEAFLPQTQNTILSGFTLQEVTQASNTFTLGGRVESTKIDNEESHLQRNYTSLSSSGGIIHRLNATFSTSLNLSYTQRAPNFQEVFANGPHLATGTFERGDDELKKENAYAVDLGFKFKQQNDSITFNIYRQEFKDYVALSPTGIEDIPSGLDVYQYEQVDAAFYGFDLEARKQLADSPYIGVFKSDYVRGINKDNGKNLPRISPGRVSIGLEKQQDRWIWDVEAQYNFMQSKTAPDEFRTNGYTLLNAGVTYDLPIEGKNFSSFLRLKNILNQEARSHASTLKEIAPMPSRNLVAGVQYLF